MTTYLYQCRDCKRVIEHDTSYGELPQDVVDEPHNCTSTQLRRTLSPIRWNQGYRELIHSPNDKWMFTHANKD